CDVLVLGGDEFSYIYQHAPDESVFKILCKDASRFLHERLQGFHSVVAMSATLTPFAFSQDVLGFPAERTFTAEFPSPFPAANRNIMVIPEISTTYRERERDAPRTAQIIDTIVAQHHGNYGVFFPSFAYLRLVRSWLRYPAYQLVEQTETMSDADRAAVLARLQQRDADPVLLLAVQGGIFAEGVDYPGDMLIGVIIVGPGLPRVDFEQELIRTYYDDKYTSGFAYAYLYPGMNRVVQSAGRLIRSETDVGIIALLDKRFTYSNYTALFPSHWYTHTPRELVTRDYQQALARFWAGQGKRERRWALRLHRLLLYDQMKVGLTAIEQESEVSSSLIIRNPKRNRNACLGRASWYPYYAGFSPYFAQSLLASSGLDKTACIGDPWNGSGTTTTSAALLGHRAYGYDLNPVMVIVAKARLISQQETHLIWPITTNILQESQDDSANVIVEDDPLCTWLTPKSAASIRQLDRTLQYLLVENTIPSRLGVYLNAGKLTFLAAFFYTALFSTVSTILKPFYASNPTWMKQPHNKDARLQFPLETLVNIFHHEIGSMVTAITHDLYTTDVSNGAMHIAVASSDALPVQNGMIDLI